MIGYISFNSGYHTKIMCPNCTPNWYALNLPGPNLSGPNLPGPDLLGPNLPGPNLPGPNLPPNF